MKLNDLMPAPYNPRTISPSALGGLTKSLSEFGDLSGIVWNKRSGYLIAGHQRLAILKSKYGDKLNVTDMAITTPNGRYPIRIVDWDEPKAKAANIAANNPHISGLFDEQLDGLLKELTDELPELMTPLLLDNLQHINPTIPTDNINIDEDELKDTKQECPKCGFKW